MLHTIRIARDQHGIYTDTHLHAEYGVRACLTAEVEAGHCCECPAQLRDMACGELWYYAARIAHGDGKLFCPACYVLAEPRLKEQELKRLDGQRKMPRQMNAV